MTNDLSKRVGFNFLAIRADRKEIFDALPRPSFDAQSDPPPEPRTVSCPPLRRYMAAAELNHIR
jgi:hypothetical protein